MARDQRTKFDPKKHHRRSIRLQGYDYSQAGAYFITIVAYQRECLFGEITNGEMRLNGYGKIVQWEWLELPKRISYLELGAYIVMPNHFHAILMFRESVGATRQDLTKARSSNAPLYSTSTNGIGGSPLPTIPNDVRATRPDLTVTHSGKAGLHNEISDGIGGSPLTPRGPKPASLGAIMAQFKSRVTKRLWKIPALNGTPIWQRNYYERIIRNADEANRIHLYIESNPARWDEDDENPRHHP